MINDEQARKIALFFLFTFMDEKVAFQAAGRTVATLKARGGLRSRKDSLSQDATLIEVLRASLDQHRRLIGKLRSRSTPAAAWSLPDGVEIDRWVKFQQSGSETEIVAVVLSYILGFSEEDIATGMSLSLGTVRYRIGKGIRQLGEGIKARA